MRFDNLRTIALDDIIPQRAPFQMIDCVTHMDAKTTVSEFAIKADNLFVSNGSLSPSGLTENIAQTCAARIGLANLYSGQSVKLGFIGAIRNLILYRAPKVGEVLTTSVTVKEDIFGMTLIDSDIQIGDEVIVTGEMKIALSNIEAV